MKPKNNRPFFLLAVPLLALVALLIILIARPKPAVPVPTGTATSPRIAASPAATVISPGEANTPLPTDIPPTAATPQYPRLQFESDGVYLTIEILDDDLVHFELTALEPQGDSGLPVSSSPMVVENDFTGPGTFTDNGSGAISTGELAIKVEPQSLCFTLSDITRSPAVTLTRLCPAEMSKDEKVITLSPETMQAIYGLGEQFTIPCPALTGRAGSLDDCQLDWIGRQRRPGNKFGNAMTGFSGGSTGNAQFPVMYALSSDGSVNYALFVDSLVKLDWNFRKDPWEIHTWDDQARGYFLAGPDLPDLRADFMALVGRPPVPPKKAFGLWISEYGFDNWAELDDKLATLRANGFPVDGVVMDLQWFGGIASDETSHMGYVAWDSETFPDPAAKIAELRQQGVGMVVIEESYIGKKTPSYADLAEQGFMVKIKEGGDPVTLFGWWGYGGMMDWTNPAAGDFWHDLKRQPLVEMGILGHWTDLGEPEMYQEGTWYYGFPELDKHDQLAVHNYYNFAWSESIARGYARNSDTQRPFILSRSGTTGIQRFGTLMWSGDIGSDFTGLAEQFNAQAHMAFSGMDYFGADIGGFHRGGLTGEALDTLYTPWFAAGSLLDVPVRVHTENLCNCKETAPDRVGDLASNRANIRLRYELSPYLYSLAYRAYLYGEPVVPPLVFYYQDDPNTWQLGYEKLLGQDLLAATVSMEDVTQRDVYLPAGTWINYYTNEPIVSEGQWVSDVPTYDDLFRLPLFARAGAIIPEMYVDDQTLDMLGLRTDGSVRDELILRVFASPSPTSFTLYEDDGQTIAYQLGAYRTTELSQRWTENGVAVTIAAAEGYYDGAPASRANMIELVAPPGLKMVGVTLNGQLLASRATLEEFQASAEGCFIVNNGLILAKSGKLDVSSEKVFVFKLDVY